jgi:hypothetical protein
MAKHPTNVCNFSIPGELCTYDTCCLEQGQVTYLPTIPGNGVYLGAFIVVAVLQIFFGFRYKAKGFMIGITLGCIGEAVGYGGRIWMVSYSASDYILRSPFQGYNIFEFNAFLINLVPLTIAPAFITASIYLCLSRIVTLYDPTISVSRFKPLTYSYVFVTADLVSLILQAAGGAIAAMGDTPKDTDLVS